MNYIRRLAVRNERTLHMHRRPINHHQSMLQFSPAKMLPNETTRRANTSFAIAEPDHSLAFAPRSMGLVYLYCSNIYVTILLPTQVAAVYSSIIRTPLLGLEGMPVKQLGISECHDWESAVQQTSLVFQPLAGREVGHGSGKHTPNSVLL